MVFSLDSKTQRFNENSNKVKELFLAFQKARWEYYIGHSKAAPATERPGVGLWQEFYCLYVVILSISISGV